MGSIGRTEMSIETNENFCLSVLTALKVQGLKDLIIACIDNLTSFAETITTIYPQVIQNYIIHQIRNSLKYIASKGQKEFMDGLKTVYQAPNLDLAELNRNRLQDKWDKNTLLFWNYGDEIGIN